MPIEIKLLAPVLTCIRDITWTWISRALTYKLSFLHNTIFIKKQANKRPCCLVTLDTLQQILCNSNLESPQFRAIPISIFLRITFDTVPQYDRQKEQGFHHVWLISMSPWPKWLHQWLSVTCISCFSSHSSLNLN